MTIAIRTQDELACSKSGRTPKRCLTVRFDESCNQEYSKDVGQEDNDVSHCWYSYQDYQAFRLDAQETVRSIQEMDVVFRMLNPEASYVGIMERAFEYCRQQIDASDDDDDDDPQNNEDYTILPQHLLDDMTNLFRNNYIHLDSIGLQRFAVSYIKKRQLQSRNKLFRKFYRYQDDYIWNCPHEMEKALVNVCQENNRVNGLWAQCLAQAQVRAE